MFRTVINQTSNIEFFRIKIRELLSVQYAFHVFCSEDGFTLNKIQLENSSMLLIDKNMVKVANSYFKIHVIKLFFELYFSKGSILDTTELSKSFSFLIELEKYRFKFLTIDSKLLSYKTVHEMFESDTSLFTSFLYKFSTSDQFKKALETLELKDNYKMASKQSELGD